MAKAMRGYAKFLLTPAQLQKQKNDLSYGCPITKICHVQCKKDTYRIVKHTVSKKLIESIKFLNQSWLVIIINESWDKVQAVYVPKEATDFRIDAECRLEYNLPSQGAIERKELDAKFHGLSPETLTIDATIWPFKVYVTGDLAFYALVLGKPNSSSHWCTWCDSPKKWYSCPTLVASAMKWMCEKLKQAKMQFNSRTARSQKTNKGVSAHMLMDGVEPEDFIFPVLHDQMGLVNKSLDHLLTFAEKFIERLPPGHAEMRQELINAEKVLAKAKEDKEGFVATGKVRMEALKSRLKSNPGEALATEICDEISQLEDEKARLDKNVGDAKKREQKAKEKYKDMQKTRGKTEGSFAY